MKKSEPEVGPSQMHNLIELVKKEQNIYDTVFYEIIRYRHFITCLTCILYVKKDRNSDIFIHIIPTKQPIPSVY